MSSNSIKDVKISNQNQNQSGKKRQSHLVSREAIINSRSRKHRKNIAMAVKLEIIRRLENGESNSVICHEYNLPSSTVSTIRTNKERIKAFCKQNTPQNQYYNVSYPRNNIIDEVEFELYKWIKERKYDLETVRYGEVKQKALKFYNQQLIKQGIKEKIEFKASHGWFDRFRKRFADNNISKLKFLNSNENNLTPSAAAATTTAAAHSISQAIASHSQSSSSSSNSISANGNFKPTMVLINRLALGSHVTPNFEIPDENDRESLVAAANINGQNLLMSHVCYENNSDDDIQIIEPIVNEPITTLIEHDDVLVNGHNLTPFQNNNNNPDSTNGNSSLAQNGTLNGGNNNSNNSSNRILSKENFDKDILELFWGKMVTSIFNQEMLKTRTNQNNLDAESLAIVFKLSETIVNILESRDQDVKRFSGFKHNLAHILHPYREIYNQELAVIKDSLKNLNQ